MLLVVPLHFKQFKFAEGSLKFFEYNFCPAAGLALHRAPQGRDFSWKVSQFLLCFPIASKKRRAFGMLSIYLPLVLLGVFLAFIAQQVITLKICKMLLRGGGIMHPVPVHSGPHSGLHSDPLAVPHSAPLASPLVQSDPIQSIESIPIVPPRLNLQHRRSPILCESKPPL